MDVKTGQILSMANLVSTHPDAPVPATARPPPDTGGRASPSGPRTTGQRGCRSNTAVTQLYEPGSVFKLVTFSAALQDGLINPNSVFTVPDQITLDGSTFHDADPHPTEQLTATQILAQSSNIGTSEIAQGLGEQRLLAQVGNLGFGKYDRPRLPRRVARPGGHRRPVGADRLRVPAHRAGRRRQRSAGPRRLQRGGQRRHLRPTQAGAGHDQPIGRRARQTAPSPTHRVFSPAVDSELTTMLEQVVSTREPAPAPSCPGYTVAGKTGTAQIPTTGKDAYTVGRLHGLVRRASPRPSTRRSR